MTLIAPDVPSVVRSFESNESGFVAYWTETSATEAYDARYKLVVDSARTMFEFWLTSLSRIGTALVSPLPSSFS